MADELEKPSGDLHPSTYILSPIAATPFESVVRRWGPLDYLVALLRQRYVAGAVFLSVVLGTLLISTALPKTYHATATLVVRPRVFADELLGPSLSPDAYKSLADSDYVRLRVRELLIAQGFEAGQLGIELRSAIQGRPGPRDQQFLPLINLSCQAADAKIAEAGANAWARVLREETSSLSGRGQAGMLEFLGEQYPRVAQEFDAKEDLLNASRDRLEQELLDLESQWLRRKLRFDQETDQELFSFRDDTQRSLRDFTVETELMTRDHEKETERLRLGLLDRGKPDVLLEELRIHKAKLVDFEDKSLNVKLEVKSLTDQVERLVKEMANHPRYLVVSKAITDEALWARMPKEGAPPGLPPGLDSIKLRSELLNPTRLELEVSLAEKQVTLDALADRAGHLGDEITSIRTQIDTLSKETTRQEIELFNLKKDREQEYRALQSKRAQMLESLRERRETEFGIVTLDRTTERQILGDEANISLSVKQREMALAFERGDREKGIAEDSFRQLATKVAAANLARGEDPENLRLAVPAVVPERADGPRRIWVLLFGSLVGAIGALMVAFFRESGLLEALSRTPMDRASPPPSSLRSPGQRRTITGN